MVKGFHTPVLHPSPCTLMGEAQCLQRPLCREGCPLEWELFSCLLRRACFCLNLLPFLPLLVPFLKHNMPAVGSLSEYLSPDKELAPTVSPMQRQQARSECWSFCVLPKTYLRDPLFAIWAGSPPPPSATSLKGMCTIMLL